MESETEMAGSGTHPPSRSSVLYYHNLLQIPQPLQMGKRFPFHFWEDAVPPESGQDTQKGKKSYY